MKIDENYNLKIWNNLIIKKYPQETFEFFFTQENECY